MADIDPTPCMGLLPDVDAFNSCVSDLADNQSIGACVDAGNVVTAPLDAKIRDVAANWKPLDTFSGEQIRAIVSATLSVLDQAQNAINQASQQGGLTDALKGQLSNETQEIARHRAQADLYVQAAQLADGTGSPVAAPNIKQWVINAMNEASNATVTAYTVGCVTPWWASFWGVIQNVFGVLAATVMAIAGTALAAGKIAVKAVETAVTAASLGVRFIAFVADYWPLLTALVAGAGYLWYRKRTYGAIFPASLKSKLPFPAFFHHKSEA